MKTPSHTSRALARLLPAVLACLVISLQPPVAHAQGPKGRSIGVGFSLGDPTAVSFRFWIDRANSWDAAIGRSHFGSPHLQAGYLWHMNDVFNSRIVSIYLGAGAAIGFGAPEGDWWFHHGHDKYDEWWYDHEDNIAVAARGVFGLNIIPRNTPLDIFLEIDPMLGLVPGFGFDLMPAVGIRFYP